jgi:hypothetical protein
MCPVLVRPNSRRIPSSAGYEAPPPRVEEPVPQPLAAVLVGEEE